MTNNEYAAIEIMGWTLVHNSDNGDNAVCESSIYDCMDGTHVWSDQWHPDTDRNQLATVFARMRIIMDVQQYCALDETWGYAESDPAEALAAIRQTYEARRS